MSIFSTFLELHFSGLKNILYYPEYEKCFFCLFLAKKNIWEKGRFFDKNHGLNPLQNVDFFDLLRNSLFRSKKHSLLSRISKNVSFWLFLAKKNIWEKGRFFDQNHGLNPLQNVDFFDFFKTSLFRSKKHSLLSRISKTVSFWLFFAEKKHIRKRSIFWPKPWTNPFAKCRFFRLF